MVIFEHLRHCAYLYIYLFFILLRTVVERWRIIQSLRLTDRYTAECLIIMYNLLLKQSWVLFLPLQSILCESDPDMSFTYILGEKLGLWSHIFDQQPPRFLSNETLPQRDTERLLGLALIENLVDLFGWTDYPEYEKFIFPWMLPHWIVLQR